MSSLRDFAKRWWEFFSDADVKWTFGAMMFLCWVVMMWWLIFSSVRNNDLPQYDQEQAGPE